MAGFDKHVRILEQLAIYPLLVKKPQNKINGFSHICSSNIPASPYLA
jgi:hypothetical protein